MSRDFLQQAILAELGHPDWVLAASTEATATVPVDAEVVAWLARALRIPAEQLAAAGIALPDAAALRDAACKRALWPQLRRLYARP